MGYEKFDPGATYDQARWFVMALLQVLVFIVSISSGDFTTEGTRVLKKQAS